MSTLRPPAVAFAVVVLTCLLGAATPAHHSRAGYDTAKERLTTHNGVVAEVIWRNPHVYLIWGNKDDKGTLVNWTGEFSSPATMMSEGLSRDTFKGWRSVDGDVHARTGRYAAGPGHGTLEAQITVIDPKTYTKPWVTPRATISLVPGAELWEDFCVPSDYNAFNNDVYLPVANGGQK